MENFTDIVENLKEILPLCPQETDNKNLNTHKEKYSEWYSYFLNYLFPYLSNYNQPIIKWKMHESSIGLWIDECEYNHKFMTFDFQLTKHKIKYGFFHGNVNSNIISSLSKKYPYLKIEPDSFDKNFFYVFLENFLFDDRIKELIVSAYNKKISKLKSLEKDFTKKKKINVFEVGKKYTRQDIYDILSVPPHKQKGIWNTGYHKYRGQWFVFANIGKSRTGHDYENYWDNDHLIWRTKKNYTLSNNSTKDLINDKSIVHIFTRNESREPFIYQGKGTAINTKDTNPVTVIWEFNQPQDNLGTKSANEVDNDTYYEGSVKKVKVNAYERNNEARQKCIDHYGAKCIVCDLNLSEIYGEIADGFIHVHHKVPLYEIGKEYKINPIKDLCPVCPNCHSIIHKRKPAYTIEEVKKMIRRNN